MTHRVARLRRGRRRPACSSGCAIRSRCGWPPSPREDPDDREAFDAWLARMRANPTVIQKMIWVDGSLVGSISTFEMEGEREVSYWVDRAVWGRGIASRALAAMLELDTPAPADRRVPRPRTRRRRRCSSGPDSSRSAATSTSRTGSAPRSKRSSSGSTAVGRHLDAEQPLAVPVDRVVRLAVGARDRVVRRVAREQQGHEPDAGRAERPVVVAVGGRDPTDSGFGGEYSGNVLGQVAGGAGRRQRVRVLDRRRVLVARGQVLQPESVRQGRDQRAVMHRSR